MNTTIPYKSIITVTAVLATLFIYNFTTATWNPAPPNPPTNNVDAPINVGADAQVKVGNLGANVLAANNEMWSPRYCDENGQNCFSAGDVNGSEGTGGAGGSDGWLFAKQHTEDQCTALDGEVVTAGGETICRFSNSFTIFGQQRSAFCPAGWAQLNSWSTTQSNTCRGSGWWGCGVRSVTTGSHVWSNTPQETHTYRTDGVKEDGDASCASFRRETCYAIITQIGCY